jgi:hypothetical protein
MASFTPLLLYPIEEEPRRLGGPHSLSGQYGDPTRTRTPTPQSFSLQLGAIPVVPNLITSTSHIIIVIIIIIIVTYCYYYLLLLLLLTIIIVIIIIIIIAMSIVIDLSYIMYNDLWM